MMPTRIVIFAKTPLPGFAKTRLIPALGETATAELAEQLILHTLKAALLAELGPVELCVTPTANSPFWQEVSARYDIELTEQGEGDLGQRLLRASRRALSLQSRVLLIGTDCPELDADILSQTASSLQNHDAAMIPAFDGGYVLLGLKEAHPHLFEDIPWSTETVADTTMNRLDALDWQTHKAEALHDIDTPNDLQCLPDHLRADYSTSKVHDKTPFTPTSISQQKL